MALKANEKENKASATILPSDAASATLAEKPGRLAEDVRCSDIEPFLLRRKFDENEQPVVLDSVGTAGIEAFQIHCFDDQTRRQVERHLETRGCVVRVDALDADTVQASWASLLTEIRFSTEASAV